MPKPVAAFKGNTKSPDDCLAPMVIIKTAEALSSSGQVDRFLAGSDMRIHR
jgi:hypothetical protein